MFADSLLERDGFEPSVPRHNKLCVALATSRSREWIVLENPIFQAFRKRRALLTINPFNEVLHPIPRKPRGNHVVRI